MAIQCLAYIFALENLYLEDQTGLAGAREKRRSVVAAERKHLLERLKVPIRLLGVGEPAPLPDFRSRRTRELVDSDVDFSPRGICERSYRTSELRRRNIFRLQVMKMTLREGKDDIPLSGRDF